MLPALAPPCVVPVRRSPEPVLLWVRDGLARVVVDGRAHRVVAGQAIRVAAGVPHGIRTAPGAVVVPIWLPAHDDRPAIGRTVGTSAEAPATVLSVPVDGEPMLLHLFAQSLGYLRSTDVPLLDLAALAARLPAAATPTSAPAARTVSPPDLRPPMPRSPDARAVAGALVRDPGSVEAVGELAARAGLSARTLQRRFLDETGLTVTAWRSRLRLATAAERLARGQEVGRVAAEVGFESASAFTRAFRALTGVTPRTVRGPGGPAGPRTGSVASAGPVPPGAARSVASLPLDDLALPSAETWPRINGSHVAVWVLRGTAHADVAERTWDLGEGDAIVLPAGVRTRVRVDPDSLLLPLGYRPGTGAPIVPDALTVARFGPADVPLLLHGIVAAYTPLRPAGHRSTALFDEVAARGVRTSGMRSAGPSAAVAALTGHLVQHPLDRTPLAVWARRTGTDERTLGAAFRATTGVDLPQWRRLSRMTRGREWLTHGVAPSVAARHLGYAHLSAFSRAFAAAYGVAPQQFQAQARGSATAVARRAVAAAAGPDRWDEHRQGVLR